MKNTTISVFISDEAAAKDTSLNRALLDEAVASGKTQGPMFVVASRGHRNRADKSGPLGYWLVTDCAIEAEAEDLLDTSECDVALQVFGADEEHDLLYVLNHDGLPLYQNGLVRETFRIRKGRVSVAAAEAAFGELVVWISQNRPELIANINTPDGIAAAKEAFASRK